MSGCFVDTTVFTDALLKPKRQRKDALEAISEFSASQLPVYAIKEFKAGPLDNAIWFHNSLAETGSLIASLAAMNANWRRRYRTSTANELLQAALSELKGTSLAEAATAKETDRQIADELRYSIRRIIKKAWATRRAITKEVVEELSCFSEKAPYYDESLRLFENPDTKCPKNQDCCFADELRDRPADLEKLIKAIEGATRDEDNKRRAALRTLKNTPNRLFDEKACRQLGDAYFALYCPDGFTILTSNDKDHAPLAKSLGKTATAYRSPRPNDQKS